MGIDLVVTPQEVWKFGTQERVARGTPIRLVGRVVNGVAESRYSRLLVPGAAAGYVVTAGRTLLLTRVVFRSTVAAATWHLISADAAVADNTLAAPAGEVAEDSVADQIGNAFISATANAITVAEIYAEIAAARGVGVLGFTGSTSYFFNVYGVEV